MLRRRRLAENYPDGATLQKRFGDLAWIRTVPVSRAFAAAFVSTASFARHCEVQIADGSAAERDRRRFGAVSGFNLAGTLFRYFSGRRIPRRGETEGQNAPRGAKLSIPCSRRITTTGRRAVRTTGAVSRVTRAVTGRLVTEIVRRPRFSTRCRSRARR